MVYTYQHFSRSLLAEDAAFSGGRRPGEQMPDFDLQTTTGERLRKKEYVGHKPMLMVFGSYT